MRIAFFAPGGFSLTFGNTKNRIELSEALTKLGWECFLITGQEVLSNYGSTRKADYKEALKSYLTENAEKYDVVLYEFDSLPYDRSLFSKTTLFVARPALLGSDLHNIEIPLNIKAKVRTLVERLLSKLVSAKAERKKQSIQDMHTSFANCDVIQVQNTVDASLLVKMGHSPEKIALVPNGISDERFSLFQSIKRDYSRELTIAFVGTFDFRKGAMDFPYIVSKVYKMYPGTKFKLLGTKGLFATQEQVYRFFPKKLHSLITVIPTFDPMELPALLQDCHLGIFPSYHESFGFGALEMMCAGLPVVAYRAAGPGDFIIPELLVDIGDKITFANKVLELIQNKERLQALGYHAQKICKKYRWSLIAVKAAEEYTRRRENLLQSDLV
ncbi:glycosyltransferase family 4 protein [Arcticibacter sp. MXS-1]|uniref:glycosyltransferase family 4 protein n=1 Tax=Arcticibacter sp. MXS-1 TaxID=3341726 RepID=UPI0035A8BC04